MPTALDDTICAIASAEGGAARGVVRLSGPDALGLAAAVFESDSRDASAATRPCVIEGRLVIGAPWPPTPCVLYAWPEGSGYTGEPSVEWHTIGATPWLSAVVTRLCRDGARLAAPGEFTMRAFLSGRIDLTRAEAVLGVIDARDDDRLRVALEQLAGGLAHPLAALRERLIETLAHLEAGFDFADEEIEFITPEQLRADLGDAIGQVEALRTRMQDRAAASERPRVVLAGRPNVGKSRLFNALVGEAASREAIVADVAGTTRDYLAVEIRWRGAAFELVDTAGLVDADRLEDIDAAAQAAARSQHGAADVEVLCLDATRSLGLEDVDRLAVDHARRIVVWTKCDAEDRSAEVEMLALTGEAPLRTSAATGQGIDALRDAIRAAVVGDETVRADAVPGTAMRCRESLDRAASALRAALEEHDVGGGEELIAGELRIALEELGAVVGAVHTDDILDRVFSRFCVGK